MCRLGLAKASGIQEREQNNVKNDLQGVSGDEKAATDGSWTMDGFEPIGMKE